MQRFGCLSCEEKFLVYVYYGLYVCEVNLTSSFFIQLSKAQDYRGELGLLYRIIYINRVHEAHEFQTTIYKYPLFLEKERKDGENAFDSQLEVSKWRLAH